MNKTQQTLEEQIKDLKKRISHETWVKGGQPRNGSRRALKIHEMLLEKKRLEKLVNTSPAWIWTGAGVEYNGKVISMQDIINLLNNNNVTAA